MTQAHATAMQAVLEILETELALNGRAAGFTADTPLLGALPELDSMAVIGLINAMQERFGFYIEDDEIDGSAFATVGAMVGFIENKLAQG